MSVVPGVLLNHVEHDPPEGNWPSPANASVIKIKTRSYLTAGVTLRLPGTKVVFPYRPLEWNHGAPFDLGVEP